jgi:hypothetical protein
MKNILSIIALSATLVTGVAAPSAFAATIFQYGYSGSVPDNSGVDAFGNGWQWSTAGSGNSAWGTPGLGAGTVTYGGANPSNNFEITFLLPFGTSTVIDQTPSPSPSGYNEYTRMTVDGVAWTPYYTGGNQIAFFAPSGVWATSGSTFFVNAVFTGGDLSGANSGFSATWTSTTAAPEPATWAMMLAGFAGLAFAGYRRQTAKLAA